MRNFLEKQWAFSILVYFLFMIGIAWAANTKLSALTELAEAPAGTDEIYINDGGTSKKITITNLFGWLSNLTNGDDIRVATTTDGHEFSLGVYDSNGSTWRYIIFENGDSSQNNYTNWPRMVIPSGVAVTGLGIPAPTLESDELDTYAAGAATLLATELWNTKLTNKNLTVDLTYNLPALADDWYWETICEAANYDITIHPNGSDVIVLNGTALDGGDKVTNTCATQYDSIVCRSTESVIMCDSNDADWIDGGA